MEDPDWLEKLHFMMGMTSHLNTVNKSVSGKGNTALQMLEDVLAFERKLIVFAIYLFLLLFTTCDNRNANCSWAKIQFRREKNIISFPITLLDIVPSLLNTSAFTGVSQPDLEIELADIADKALWVSEFKSLTAELEDVARQKAIFTQNYKWSDIKNLPKPNKLELQTRNAIPDNYVNMEK